MATDILLWKNKVWESKVSNTGDLAIIRNTFRKLEEAIPGVRLHIISDDPDYAAAHYGIEAHPVGILASPRKLLALLRRMDLVIMGGGTVFQDNYFVGIIPINLSVPMLARAVGTPIVANAIGVGSEREVTIVGETLCRLALPHFDAVTVRDVESQRTVETWGRGQVPVVELTNDIAVDLPPAPIDSLREALDSEGLNLSRPTVAIAARQIFHHEKTPLYVLPGSLRRRLGLRHPLERVRVAEFEETLTAFADRIIEEHGVQIVFTPFYASGGSVDARGGTTPTRLFTSGDTDFAQRVRSGMRHGDDAVVLRRNYAPEELLAIIGQCEAMVGVPYHSVVFASSQNVPVVGINYVSKVRRYLRILGLEEYAVEARIEDGLDPAVLDATFDRLWSRRTSIREHLAARNPELHELSDANVRVIRDVLAARRSHGATGASVG